MTRNLVGRSRMATSFPIQSPEMLMKYIRLGILTFFLIPSLAQASPLDDAMASPAVQSLMSGAADMGIRFGGGLGIFLMGWFVARVLSWILYRALIKTTLDDKLAQALGLTFITDRPGDENRLERILASIAFWTMMMFVTIAALNQAGLAGAAMPFQTFLETVAGALPNVGKAALLMGVSYIAALVARRAVTASLEGSAMHKRFAELSAPTQGDASGVVVSQNAGTAVFWLILVMGLAGAGDALQIAPLSDPLRNVMNQIVGLLPSLGLGILFVSAGWVFGRIARTIIQNLMASFGVDSLAERAQLGKILGGKPPSDLLDITAQVFIVLQAAIAALNQVGLSTLADPLTDMMSRFWMLLPDILVGILLLGVGWSVGGIVRNLVTRALKNVGFDSILERLGFSAITNWNENLNEPSEFVGAAAQGGIVLVAATQVLDNLGLRTWKGYVESFLGYVLQNVTVSIIILCVGFAIGNMVRDIVAARKDVSPEAQRWLAGLARMTILVFAVTASIQRLQIAEDFVLLAFGLMFGGLCLATALAFGLGSREVAGEIVRRQYERAQKELEKAPQEGS